MKLQKEAEKERQNLSVFIRRKVLKSSRPQVPGEVMEQLRELNYLNRKLGNNVNQIAHICNARQEVTVFDYENVIRIMQKLEKKTDQIYEFFKGVYG